MRLTLWYLHAYWGLNLKMPLKEEATSEEKLDPLLRTGEVEARSYQQSIAETSCDRNTLVVLPTALGKTVIAAMVAARLLRSHRGLRVLVMAPTRPLVLQHQETYLRILEIGEDEATVLIGRTPAAHRKRIWDGGSKLIFATPQVVKNDLEDGLITLKDFGLLVFDECHRARKEYAYTHIAKRYVEDSPWPIILGMTASPGADRDKVGEICEALFIEQIQYRSEEDPDVAPYVNPVKVEWKLVDLPLQYKPVSRMLRSILQDRVGSLIKFGLIHRKPEYVNRRDLLEVGKILRARLIRASQIQKGPIYNAIVSQSASLTLFHTLELLETQGVDILQSFLQKIESESRDKRSWRTIINDTRFKDLKQFITENSNVEHPKIQALRREIENQLKQNPNSKMIIFTQYRDTASKLVERLRKWGLPVERFVGQSSKALDLGLSQDEQAKVLDRFRNGETSALVATSIAEEGLDIPSVDLVIFYEPIPSEIRYIQRKGRTGRKTAGRAVILAANQTFDTAYLYASKRRVERMRKVTATLNRQLKPFHRRGPEPKPDILASQEATPAKKTTDSVETVKIEAEKSNKDSFTMDNFIAKSDVSRNTQNAITQIKTCKSQEAAIQKEARKAGQLLMKKILKAGFEGLSREALIREAAEEGITRPLAEKAIETLQELGQVSTSPRGVIKGINAVDPNNGGGELYEVTVEKVYPGVADVTISDVGRAKISASEFDASPTLLKKEARLKVRGALHKRGDELYLKVDRVIQQLSG